MVYLLSHHFSCCSVKIVPIIITSISLGILVLGVFATCPSPHGWWQSLFLAHVSLVCSHSFPNHYTILLAQYKAFLGKPWSLLNIPDGSHICSGLLQSWIKQKQTYYFIIRKHNNDFEVPSQKRWSQLISKCKLITLLNVELCDLCQNLGDSWKILHLLRSNKRLSFK